MMAPDVPVTSKLTCDDPGGVFCVLEEAPHPARAKEKNEIRIATTRKPFNRPILPGESFPLPAANKPHNIPKAGSILANGTAW